MGVMSKCKSGLKVLLFQSLWLIIMMWRYLGRFVR